jgi:hypothetical protein
LTFSLRFIKQEKGPEYATLEMPPNHSHFSLIPSESLGRTSLLSVRRQQLDEQSNLKKANATAPAAAAAHAMPIFNINFPPEMFQAVRGAPSAEPVHHAPAPALLPPPAVSSSLSLFSATQLASPGRRMSLVDFCSAYDLSQTLHSKLSDHGFSSSHSLRYVTLDDLQKVGLLCGELAELKDAIARWCGE